MIDNSVFVFDPGSKRHQFIGRTEGRVFAQVCGGRHVFNVDNGKGIDVAVLASLRQRGIKVWRLTFATSGDVLEIPLADIEKKGVRKETGAGLQLMVPLLAFTSKGGK